MSAVITSLPDTQDTQDEMCEPTLPSGDCMPIMDVFLAVSPNWNDLTRKKSASHSRKDETTDTCNKPPVLESSDQAPTDATTADKDGTDDIEQQIIAQLQKC